MKCRVGGQAQRATPAGTSLQAAPGSPLQAAESSSTSNTAGTTHSASASAPEASCTPFSSSHRACATFVTGWSDDAAAAAAAATAALPPSPPGAWLMAGCAGGLAGLGWRALQEGHGGRQRLGKHLAAAAAAAASGGGGSRRAIGGCWAISALSLHA